MTIALLAGLGFIVELAVYAALVGRLVYTGTFASGIAVVAMAVVTWLLLRLVLVLVSIGLSRYFRREPWSPMRPGDWLRLVFDEWMAIARHQVFCLPFYRWTMPRVPAVPGGPLPVILVHGLWNNAGVWSPLVHSLEERERVNVFWISYEPPWGDIDAFGDALARVVERVCALTGHDRVMMICHSMGGLVARAYMRRHGSARISRVVSIGAPHHGSGHAWLAVGRCGRQLRPGNPWLEELARSPLPAGRFVSVWSEHDNLVSPQKSGVLAGAESRPVAGIAHNAMHFSAKIRDLLVHEILESANAPLTDPALVRA